MASGIMGKSKIEWTEVTWNPLVGCNKVSQGCKNCYALQMSARIANQGNKRVDDGEEPTPVQRAYMDSVYFDTSKMKYVAKWTGKMRTIPERLEDPLRWQKPRMVFVNSMSDLFHPDVPFDFIDKVFAVMALAEKHTFQVLTKRPDRMAEYYHNRWYTPAGHTRIVMAACEYGGNSESVKIPIPNVWLGTSVEDQQAADQRIPHLLQCQAAVRFLSCEPLLGPVDLESVPLEITGASIPIGSCLNPGLSPKIHWVIAGGESGHNARPMHPDWPRSLRDQCLEADVPFFFKQWGAWENGSNPSAGRSATVLKSGEVFEEHKEAIRMEMSPGKWNRNNPLTMSKVGKKKAGRLLDGRQWNQMPEVARV